jgi:hypothetical protein
MIKEKAEFVVALRKLMQAGATEEMVVALVHRTYSAPQTRGHAGHPSGGTQTGYAGTGREPTLADRLAAIRNGRILAISVLDTFKIRDGRAIGDVRFGEVERLRAANAMEASIFEQIKSFAQAPHDARIRDVIKPKQFQRIQRRAEEAAEARHDARIRDVIKPKQFQRIQRRAEEARHDA